MKGIQMKEVIEIIMDLSIIAFAIYGIHVLVKWKKAAKEVTEMCEEICEEIRDGKEFK